MALVEYLEPKARNMIAWNSSQTKELHSNGKQGGSRCSHSMCVANQLFSIVIFLRLGLLVADVCVHFGVNEGTYSHLFTTWICFLSKELKLLFPFPTRRQTDEWMPRSIKKNFSNTLIIIDCYEIECQRPSGLMNSSITYSQNKSRNAWKTLIGCTPSGLVSFVSDAWGGHISDCELTENQGC